jgi:flagellin
MIINTNVAAINTFNALNKNTNAMNQALGELSSGKSINSAADNPSGLTISEQMQGQMNGLSQANSNTQNGISLIQTAEGGLTETSSILQTMRELAVQASNGTNTTTDLQAIQDQINQYSAQIDNIGNTTQFNTINLLNGGASITAAAAGSGAAAVTVLGGTADTKAGATVTLSGWTMATNATVNLTSGSANAGTLSGNSQLSGSAITVNGVNFNFASGTSVQSALDQINNAAIGATATLSSGNIVLTSASVGTAATLAIGAGPTGDFANVSMSGASGAITAASGAITITGTNATLSGSPPQYTASGNVITIDSGSGAGLQFKLTQAPASGSSNEQATIGIYKNGGLTLQIGANQGQTMYVSINDMRSAALGVSNLNMTTSSGAQSAITTIDNAISSVSAQNSSLGAYQDRLQDTSDNLTTANQNITSANSTLTDVDMASEMSTYSQDSVLVQAATSMLAQANQEPQTVLKLLQ